jgi:hypothetical protein
MKTFNDCCAEVGYTKPNTKDVPQLVMEYYGYEGGKVFRCKSRDESEKYKVRDSGYTKESKAACDDFWKKQARLEVAASDMFHEELRKEFSELSDSLYSLCYAEAYDRGHSAGYEEVASYMNDIVDFAKRVRACK